MRFSISDQPRFPHIKLTSEEFPRALATRMIEESEDEYFGAFLNRTNVRILIDFLNRTFRLRTCTIDIDGSFNVPCTQYYLKRCVAPCVASLCDRQSYLAIVDLVRLFLENRRGALLASLGDEIDAAADKLDFETAAFLRDIFQNCERFFGEPRWHVWLADTVDTFELHADANAVYVILISQRGRRTLGEMVYAVPSLDDPTRPLRDVIEQFYLFHLPREIRVSHDFDRRNRLAAQLGKKFGREISIKVVGSNRRVTTERAIALTKARLALEAARPRLTAKQIQVLLQKEFDLLQMPRRIEAFDVAHISASGFAAAASAWQDGKDLPDEYETWSSDSGGELDALRRFITYRVKRTNPDLILIDGGRSQLRSALRAIDGLQDPPAVITVVKPKGKHTSISHFFTFDRRIEFDQDDQTHQLLQRLRNDAHDLANATHRLDRDMLHHYELATALPSLNERERQELWRDVGSVRKVLALEPREIERRFDKRKARQVVDDIARYHSKAAAKPQPLIVPIRYVETDGAAEDLLPIVTR